MRLTRALWLVLAAAAPISTAAAQTEVSAANATYAVGAASTTVSNITVTDKAIGPVITALNDIRIQIPAAFNGVWDATVTTVTLSGGAAAKVSATVSYAPGNKIVILNVTTNFVGNDAVTVAGLKFTSFTAVSAATNLQLITGGAAGPVVATDTRTITIVGPSLSGAANQTFTVGDAATAITTNTVTDASTATITAVNDIRIRIPASLNMVWNTALTTATIGGAAAAKVSTTVTYENAGKTLVLNVTSNFAANDVITVAGLQFTTFSAPSAAGNLELVITGAGGATAATSSTTKTIYAVSSISSAANQAWNAGNAATAMSTATITEDGTPSITTANEIRIRIPTGFNMTWDQTDVTATLGGAAAAKVSTTVSYENSGQVVVLNVTSNFVAGDAITVAGLQFTSFSAPSAANNLQLVVSGSAGGATADTDDKTITILAHQLSSGANQVFTAGDPSTTVSPITVTDDAIVATITAKNDIRIQIPAAFNGIWDNTVTTVTLSGGAAGKVSTTGVTYVPGNKVVDIDVTTDFAAGDQVTVSGLKFTSFTAASAATNLQLIVNGLTTVVASDDKTIRILAPTFVGAANQGFTVGDASTAMTTNTITDDATTATITAANDLRLRIPAALNMVWNTGITTATIGGGAAGKVSTTVSYENAGKTLVLNVTSNFAASDQITVSGLQFTSFTAASAATALQLVVSGSGGATAATSDKFKTIYGPLSIVSAANQTFEVNDATTNISAITVSEDAAPSITATNDIRITIPAGVNMTWDVTDVTATLGGTAAAKASTTVSYADANKTLVIDVTTSFAAGDVLTVNGLKFANFTAVSSADYLLLVVAGAGGATAATDTKTKTVVPGIMISSGANQIFVVGAASTTVSPITVTDGSVTPSITAKNDIIIRIPAGLSMTWDNTVTTVTLTGGAAAKMTTTVTYSPSKLVVTLLVTTDFAAGDQVIISGLKATAFTTASGPASLQLVVQGGEIGPTVATDDKTITIQAVTHAVSVTPDTTRAGRLPSNGTNYTANATVTNTGNVADSYDLLTTTPVTAITVISIAGTGVTQGANPDSARLASIAPGVARAVTVTYSVGNVAAGVTDTLILTARAVGTPAAIDTGREEMTVIRPGVGVVKTVSPTGTQLPGTDLTYSVTVTNAGTAAAAGMITVDTLSANVMFKVGSVVNTLPGGFTAALAYSNDGGVTWTYVPATLACGAPAGFDRCVNRVRWTFTGALSQTSPNNVALVQFISRIR